MLLVEWRGVLGEQEEVLGEQEKDGTFQPTFGSTLDRNTAYDMVEIARNS